MRLEIATLLSALPLWGEKKEKEKDVKNVCTVKAAGSEPGTASEYVTKTDSYVVTLRKLADGTEQYSFDSYGEDAYSFESVDLGMERSQ